MIPTDQGNLTPDQILERLLRKMADRRDMRRHAHELTEHPGKKLCPDDGCRGPLERTGEPAPRDWYDQVGHARKGWYCPACERRWRFGDVDRPADRDDE